MMNCSVCSKRNALTYDEKSKKFFCENHSSKDLLPISPDLVRKVKENVISKIIN